jgi:Lhr-like helicase
MTKATRDFIQAIATGNTAKVNKGDVYVWAGKRWRVVEVTGERAKIVNVERPENTAAMPLSQFREFA